MTHCVMPVMLYMKVDAQRDKWEMVASQLLTILAMVAMLWQNISWSRVWDEGPYTRP